MDHQPYKTSLNTHPLHQHLSHLQIPNPLPMTEMEIHQLRENKYIGSEATNYSNFPKNIRQGPQTAICVNSKEPAQTVYKQREEAKESTSSADENNAADRYLMVCFEEEQTEIALQSDDPMEGSSKRISAPVGDVPFCSNLKLNEANQKFADFVEKNENKFWCTICDYSAFKKASMTDHLNTNHGLKLPYVCEKCSFNFERKEQYLTHLRTVHNKGKFKCEYCDYTASVKISLTIHMRKHTGEKPFICNICGVEESFVSQIVQHMKWQHNDTKPYKYSVSKNSSVRSRYTLKKQIDGQNVFQCDYCDYAVYYSAEILDHIRKNHKGESLHKCKVCGFATQNRSLSISHARTHKTRQYSCSICTYASIESSKLREHMRIHSGDRPYKCDFCDFSFQRNSHLKRHLMTHDDNREKTYKCDTCDYAAYDKGRLLDHNKIHTGERPYKCPHCDYSAAQNATLKYHLKSHMNQKPYKCEYCEYSAVKRKALIKHRRTHTKPFKCTICSYSGSTEGALSLHLKHHLKPKPYKCEFCDYAAGRKDHLKTHMHIHSGERPFKCDVCDYSANQKSTLTYHRNKKHAAAAIESEAETSEKSFKCEICEDFTTPTKAGLQKHMKMHNKKIFKCEMCSYEATNKINFETHLKIHVDNLHFLDISENFPKQPIDVSFFKKEISDPLENNSYYENNDRAIDNKSN